MIKIRYFKPILDIINYSEQISTQLLLNELIETVSLFVFLSSIDFLMGTPKFQTKSFNFYQV